MIIKNIEEFSQHLIIGRPVISIDYGYCKTGVAISDNNHKIAFPQSVIITRSLKEKIAKIQNLIYQSNPCAIVIGIAFSLQNKCTTNTKPSINFAQKLSTTSDLPILLQDERGTSQIVHKIDFFYQFHKKNTLLGREDMLAARYILESVLESASICKQKNNE